MLVDEKPPAVPAERTKSGWKPRIEAYADAVLAVVPTLFPKKRESLPAHTSTTSAPLLKILPQYALKGCMSSNGGREKIGDSNKKTWAWQVGLKRGG